MQIVSNNQQVELIAHHTFHVTTTHELTESYLDDVKQSIRRTLITTWIDMKPLDDVTVRVNIETVDNIDTLSETITALIQKGTIRT